MALKKAGCKVTLNSDDPPYFWTSLKREYDIAAEHFGMGEKDAARRDQDGHRRPLSWTGRPGRRCWRS